MIQEIQIFQELSGEMLFLAFTILMERVPSYLFTGGEGNFFLVLEVTSFFNIS